MTEKSSETLLRDREMQPFRTLVQALLLAANAANAMTVSASPALSSADAAKLFGRLAESQLYLDAAVGACCHSACSDCEWRLPDGGYRFDMLKSTVAKWLPCYVVRDFEDERGCHTTAWSSALFPDGAAVSRGDFDERLTAMEFGMPMGPKGSIKAGEDVPSAEALDVFWSWLSEADPTCEELEASVMLRRLQDMNPDENREGAIGEGPDFVDWKSFAKALGAAPFERW